MNRDALKWNDDRPRQGYELSLLGLTYAQMATVMDVHVHTIELWINTRPAFREHVNRGRDQADAQVVKALYKRCLGFSCMETHVAISKGRAIRTRYLKHYPPDAEACLKWLALRRRDNWSSSQRMEITSTHLNINRMDFRGFSDDELRLLQKMGMKQIQLPAASEN